MIKNDVQKQYARKDAFSNDIKSVIDMVSLFKKKKKSIEHNETAPTTTE